MNKKSRKKISDKKLVSKKTIDKKNYTGFIFDSDKKLKKYLIKQGFPSLYKILEIGKK